MYRSSNHRVPFGCTLPEELLEKLDLKRGLIPRTRFVERIIENALSDEASTSVPIANEL